MNEAVKIGSYEDDDYSCIMYPVSCIQKFPHPNPNPFTIF